MTTLFCPNVGLYKLLFNLIPHIFIGKLISWPIAVWLQIPAQPCVSSAKGAQWHCFVCGSWDPRCAGAHRGLCRPCSPCIPPRAVCWYPWQRSPKGLATPGEQELFCNDWWSLLFTCILLWGAKRVCSLPYSLFIVFATSGINDKKIHTENLSFQFYADDLLM